MTMLQDFSNLPNALQSEQPDESDGAAAENARQKLRPLAALWLQLRTRLQLANARETVEEDPAWARRIIQIEDFRPGYPQFSALIASHTSFHVCRRFLRTRARLLLVKQDEVSLLESQLDHIDREEPRELFLGNRRRDTNPERKEIITKLEDALASYDAILDGNRRILAFDNPRKQDILNMQNWVENTSSLARDETAYLFEPKDLMTIFSPQDAALARLTPVLEGFMRTLYRLLKKPQCDVSRDPNISLFSDSVLQRLTRSLIASVVVILLLVPIVILNALASIAFRLAVIVVASSILIIAVSSFTNAKTVEVFVSGATYATVLVVFISGNEVKAN